MSQARRQELRLHLEVRSVVFHGTDRAYVAFSEPYQFRAEQIGCDVQVPVSRADALDWVPLIGEEVIFARVLPLSESRDPPLQDPGGP